MRVSRALGVLLALSLALVPLSTASEIYSPLPDQRLASNEDRFGYGTAIDGDQAAVLAIGETRIYEQQADGWELSTRLSDSSSGDAVEVQGGILTLASPASEELRIYRNSADGWQLDQTLTTPSDQDDLFGTSAALDGDTLVVGADEYTNADDVETGAVYVFERTATGEWEHTDTLTPADAPKEPAFGETVDLGGSTLVVGAPRDDTPEHDSGSAYVFERSNQEGWSQVAKLTAPDGDKGDNFGDAVGTNNDMIAIGAWRADSRGVDDAGKVFLTTADRAGDGDLTVLANPVPESNDHFGDSLALDGPSLIVGTPGDQGVSQNTGAAYAYTGTGTTWVLQSRLTPEDPDGLATFGSSVAIDESTVLSGSPFAEEVLVYEGLMGETAEQVRDDLAHGEGQAVGASVGGVQASLKVGANACLDR